MGKQTAPVSIPSTLNALWDDAFRRMIPELPFIIWQDERKTRIVSWKESIAISYCMAGFLLSRGIKRGETLGVFSTNNPAVLYIELGARLLGAIPVMIPEDFATLELSEVAQKTNMKMILVSDPDTYHKALAALGANFQVKDIVTLFDDEQVLVPGRTAIFNWLLDPGKAYWRENMPEIKALKEAVHEDDVCSISWKRDDSGALVSDIHTHQMLMQRLLAAELSLQELPEATSLMPCVPFWDFDNRLKGFYLPLHRCMRLMIPHATASVENAIRELKPEVILISSAQLNGLHARLTSKLSHKGWYARKRYQNAIKAGAKWLQTLDNGQKPSIVLKWKCASAKKLLRKGILKKLNPGLKAILLSDNGVSDPAISLFLQLDIPVFSAPGFRITQGNRDQVVSLNPIHNAFVHKVETRQEEQQETDMLDPMPESDSDDGNNKDNHGVISNTKKTE